MKNKLLVWLLILFLAAGPGMAKAKSESILVISDTHMRAGTGEYDAVMDAVTAAARNRDLLLMLGDNTNNGHPEEHALVLERAVRLRKETGTEVLIIPGNHDYTSRFGAEEFSAVFRSCGTQQAFSRDTASASCAVLTAGGTCLLLLDTNRTGTAAHALPDGGISTETLVWAEKVLKELPGDIPVIACGHHPILSEGRDQRTPGAAKLAELLHAYGVTLYLCGHDHGFQTVETGGLRQITVGQPHAYPGWAGVIEKNNTGFVWRTEPIYAPDDPFYIHLREAAESLSVSMARSTLSGTPCEGDEDAVAWFSTAFMKHMSGELTPDACAALLADENSQKWRGIETRTVVKSWIFSLLEHCPDDVRKAETRLRNRD